MLLVGAKKSQRLEEIGEDSVSLLPTEPEDMVCSLMIGFNRDYR